MEKRFLKYIMICTVLILLFVLLDYINLPTLCGIDMSNINLDFWVQTVNVIVVIMLYIFTYKILDERAVHREINKNEISMMLINNCYKECKRYLEMLDQETVEKYIVPKIDFKSSHNVIISNLQNAPYTNENVIFDLVKDGQVTRQQIDCYLKIKEKYQQYITTRITFFDAEKIYGPLKHELCKMISKEIEE